MAWRATPGRVGCYASPITGSINWDGDGATLVSSDGGKTFTHINDDRPQWGVGARVLAGDMRGFGVVYIGTNGRGIIMGSPAPAGAR